MKTWQQEIAHEVALIAANKVCTEVGQSGSDVATQVAAAYTETWLSVGEKLVSVTARAVQTPDTPAQ